MLPLVQGYGPGGVVVTLDVGYARSAMCYGCIYDLHLKRKQPMVYAGRTETYDS